MIWVLLSPTQVPRLLFRGGDVTMSINGVDDDKGSDGFDFFDDGFSIEL